MSNLTKNMQAYTFNEYGNIDNLKLNTVAKPEAKAGEVLIQIKATSLNAKDRRMLMADPVLVRLAEGWNRPKHPILGSDVAGIVEAVGNGVKDFKPGDEVFGESLHSSFAEYIAMPASKLAKKPKNISFEEAATVPLAGVTALHGVKINGQVKPGDKVLINGATGSVGSFSLKLAKIFGGDVTAITSSKNADLVKELGADSVFYYDKQSLSELKEKFDVVIDNVGNFDTSDFKRLTKAEGRSVQVGFQKVSRLLKMKLFGGGVKLVDFKPSKKDLVYLAELLESEKLKPYIEKTYKFNELKQAMKYMAEGHVSGKLVVSI